MPVVGSSSSEQVGVGQQGEGEAQPLLLAARARADPAVGDVGDPGPFEHLTDGAGAGEQARRQTHGLGDREVLEQAAGLQDGGDAPRADGVRGRTAEDLHGPRRAA